MKHVIIYDKITREKIYELDCTFFEIEKGYYTFITSSKSIEIIPSYGLALEIKSEFDIIIK